MRRHFSTALVFLAPVALWAGAAAAQDTTQAQKQQNQYQQNRDSSNQQSQQYNNPSDGTQSDEAVLMRLHHTNQMEIRVARLAQSNGSSAKVKSFGARLVRDHSSADQKVVALAKQLGYTLTRGDGMDSTKGMYGQGRRGRPYDTTDSTRRNDSTYSSYPRSYGDTTMRNQQRDTTMGYQQRTDTTQAQGRFQGQGQYQQQNQDSTGRAEMQRLATLRGAAFDTAFAKAMVDGHQKAISMLEQAQNQVQKQELRTLISSTLPTLRQHLQTAESLSGGVTTTSSKEQ